jgi:hypothetical protein
MRRASGEVVWSAGMTKMLERLPTACPYNLAHEFLAAIVRPFADSGKVQTIELDAPVDLHDKHLARLVKLVDVEYSRGNDPMHFDQVWIVRWKPHGGGPYPNFLGELTARADEVYTSCILELTGSYEPPMGVLGAAFDAIVGSRLATATAQDLLKKIGNQLIEMYRENEASKVARPLS